MKVGQDEQEPAQIKFTPDNISPAEKNIANDDGETET